MGGSLQVSGGIEREVIGSPSPAGAYDQERTMDARWRIELIGGLRATQADRVVTRFRTQKTVLVPDARPGPNGELLYSWDRDEHHLELEIFLDAPAEFFYENDTRGSRYRRGSGYCVWLSRPKTSTSLSDSRPRKPEA